MPLNKILIYAKDVAKTATFYEQHFNFTARQFPNDRIIELVSSDEGANIMLHTASKGQKQGQSVVKLVFDIEDVETFCRKAGENGLEFGAIHQADGYQFANAKDPCMNTVSVSSRAFRPKDSPQD